MTSFYLAHLAQVPCCIHRVVVQAWPSCPHHHSHLGSLSFFPFRVMSRLLGEQVRHQSLPQRKVRRQRRPWHLPGQPPSFSFCIQPLKHNHAARTSYKRHGIRCRHDDSIIRGRASTIVQACLLHTQMLRTYVGRQSMYNQSVIALSRNTRTCVLQTLTDLMYLCTLVAINFEDVLCNLCLLRESPFVFPTWRRSTTNTGVSRTKDSARTSAGCPVTVSEDTTRIRRAPRCVLSCRGRQRAISTCALEQSYPPKIDLSESQLCLWRYGEG